jgi:hypothetical protein
MHSASSLSTPWPHQRPLLTWQRTSAVWPSHPHLLLFQSQTTLVFMRTSTPLPILHRMSTLMRSITSLALTCQRAIRPTGKMQGTMPLGSCEIRLGLHTLSTHLKSLGLNLLSRNPAIVQTRLPSLSSNDPHHLQVHTQHHHHRVSPLLHLLSHLLLVILLDHNLPVLHSDRKTRRHSLMTSLPKSLVKLGSRHLKFKVVPWILLSLLVFQKILNFFHCRIRRPHLADLLQSTPLTARERLHPANTNHLCKKVPTLLHLLLPTPTTLLLLSPPVNASL